MRVTNKYRFPEAIVRAVENDTYEGGGDISVTTLINPPQIRHLKKLHWDEIEEDVSDRIWSLFGQSMHHILERSAQEGDIVEERVYADVLGWEVSGQFDLLDVNQTLLDYKNTSVWAVKDALENGKTEWDDQLNLLAALIRLNPRYPVPKRLQILAICRDWRRTEALRYENYPARALTFDIEMMDEKAAQALLEGYVKDHQAGTRPCSDKERWARPTTWAVMKEGRKSALRVLDSEDDALDWAINQGLFGPAGWKKGHYLQERKGEYTRCESYCPVAEFCPQHKLTRLNQDLEKAEAEGNKGRVYEIEQVIDGLTDMP